MKKLAAPRIGEDVPALLEASTVGVPAVPDPDTSAFSAPPVEGLREEINSANRVWKKGTFFLSL